MVGKKRQTKEMRDVVPSMKICRMRLKEGKNLSALHDLDDRGWCRYRVAKSRDFERGQSLENPPATCTNELN